MLHRKQIPNLITGSRLLAIPVLWFFAFLDRPLVVRAGLFFAWLSDALDGFQRSGRLRRRIGDPSKRSVS